MNVNWPCEDKDGHEVQTHPADVVFFYDEPYRSERTYVHCDLKSYAKGSIKSAAIRKAIESLAKQIACAERSAEWQRLYAHEHVNRKVVGLLFVYNHDSEYDADFGTLLDGINVRKLNLPPGSRLYVLGPDDIFWLNAVRYEIGALRNLSGTNKLPAREKCKFYYPQMVRQINVRPDVAKAATLDMLTAPWIVLQHELINNPGSKGIIIFYKRKAESTHEFLYLLDYLRNFQLLNEHTTIRIKVLQSNENAMILFDKARSEYIDSILGVDSGDQIGSIIKSIDISAMDQVVATFSAIQIGMES